MNLSNRHLADRLGDIRRDIADLEEQAAELRERILDTGASTLTGDDYLVSVKTTTRCTLAPDAVRARLSPEDLEACTLRRTQKLVTVYSKNQD